MSFTTTRALYAFGCNDDGQCGVPPKKSHILQSSDSCTNVWIPSPVYFPTLVKINSISAGSRHTLALSDAGEVFSWGWGRQGQLGLGQHINVTAPTKIETLFHCEMRWISAGGIHSACIDSKGYCYTWGSASYGQLGLGDDVVERSMIATPCKIDLLSNNSQDQSEPFLITQIACGGMHTAAISTHGDVWCWGRADSGQTGHMNWIFNNIPCVSTPKLVTGINSKAKSIACGGFHTVIVTEAGQVFSMGKDDFGLLGTGSREGHFSSGAQLPTLLNTLCHMNVTKVSCGGWHSVFLTDNGETFACGKGEYGRLGLSDEISKDEPTSHKIFSNCTISDISSGGSHTLFLTSSNEVYVTGRTDFGRLGIGCCKKDKDRVLQPVLLNLNHLIHPCLPNNTEVIQVCAGGSHSFVLLEIPEVKIDSYDEQI
eukprot:gene499-947_t